jgi:NAD(P)-dependent dehydrogenase (short-subunit alcohol dehydrogenase family)
MKSIKELMGLKNRVALITGGGGHIGPVLAEALAELGAHIVLVDINKNPCDVKAKAIRKKYHVKTFSLIADLADEKKVRLIPQQVMREFKRMDILVNCAAMVGTSQVKGWAVPFSEQRSDTWRKALEINLTSIFVLVQSCVSALKKSQHGTIINASSIYGMVGPYMGLYKKTKLGNPAAYGASKGGLLQLTRYLATVLAPEIRVNAITLGGVFRGHPKIFVSRYRERTPLNRMATEEDFKGAVMYLASDLSSYVTGHNLVVDGGWTAW